MSLGTTDNPSDNNPVSVWQIETNTSFSMRNKVDKDWSGPRSIGGENTSFENADVGNPNPGYSGDLSTSFKDVYGEQSYGENLDYGINYYLDIPPGTPEGTYTTTF